MIERRGITLLGITVANLSDEAQLELPLEPRVDPALDLRDRRDPRALRERGDQARLDAGRRRPGTSRRSEPACRLPVRLRAHGERPRGHLRALPGARDDDDLRQPRLDRAADARRVPRRLPLRPRPPGGGRGRDGRRLRAGLGRAGPRQPAHRARGRQRDGRDLQRPGEPFAAAGDRRPAGPRPHHDAGEPDEPGRDARRPSVRQVELRAAAGAGRAARARARDPHRLARPEGPGVRLAADGRLERGGRGRRSGAVVERTAEPRIGPDPDAIEALAKRLAGASNPVLVAGPDIDASGRLGRRRRPGRAPEAAGVRLARARRRATRLPRGPSALPGRPAAGDRAGRRDAQGPRPDPGGRLLGLPLLPLHPRAAAARGRRAGRDHQRPRRGRPRADGRRDPGGPGAGASRAARRGRRGEPRGARRRCPSRAPATRPIR